MKSQTAFGRFQGAVEQPWFSFGYTALRVLLGLQFFFAGVEKMGDWSAASYLENATGPFATLFQSLAGNALVDALNVWGLLLIGLALILGFLVRPASLFAAMMMFLYYVAQFEQNTAHGFIDEHIIYIAIFLMFLAGGAGHTFGLNSLAEQYFSRQKRLASILFG